MARAKDQFRNLSGSDKAAIFMLSLEQEYSAKLFEMMDDEEIKELSITMANLGTIDSEIVERLFVEFAEQISSTGSLVGTMASTERALGNALGEERVATIMEEIRGPAGRTMWDKLANVNETVLANYLKNEYPQTAAVVLTKIKPEHASRVLGVLPEDFSMEVIVRMLQLEPVQKEVLDSIERTLRGEFMTNISRSSQIDPHELMADIFNSFDRSTESKFMVGLEDRNRDAAERIKSNMFTFDDLGSLDPSSVQTLLRNFEKGALALALKGGSEDVRDLFFSNMSERAGKILREDMEAMGPVRLSEVDEAQTQMISKARELSDAGEIVISQGGGEDELVY